MTVFVRPVCHPFTPFLPISLRKLISLPWLDDYNLSLVWVFRQSPGGAEPWDQSQLDQQLDTDFAIDGLVAVLQSDPTIRYSGHTNAA